MTRLTGPTAWVAKADNDLHNIRNNLAAANVPWDDLDDLDEKTGRSLVAAAEKIRARITLLL